MSAYEYSGPRVPRTQANEQRVQLRFRKEVEAIAETQFKEAVKLWALADEGMFPDKEQIRRQVAAELETLCWGLDGWGPWTRTPSSNRRGCTNSATRSSEATPAGPEHQLGTAIHPAEAKASITTRNSQRPSTNRLAAAFHFAVSWSSLTSLPSPRFNVSQATMHSADVYRCSSAPSLSGSSRSLVSRAHASGRSAGYARTSSTSRANWSTGQESRW